MTTATSESQPILGRIRRAARLAETRMRIARAVAISPVVLSLAVATAAVLLAVHKIAPEKLPEQQAYLGFAVAAGLAVSALVVAFARRLPPNAGTLALDRVHGHKGRLTN